MPLGKLQNGEKFDIIRISAEKINGFMWAEIAHHDGKKVFVAVLEDRCKLVEEMNPYEEKIKELDAEIKQLKITVDTQNAEIAGLNDKLIAKNNECSLLSDECGKNLELLLHAQEELTDIKDKMIKLEGQLEKQMAENVLLKEEVTKLEQENNELKKKVEDVPQEMPGGKNKSLIVMLIDTFFAWLKGV